MSLYDSIKKSVALKPSVKRDEVGTMFRGSFAPVAGHHHSFLWMSGIWRKRPNGAMAAHQIHLENERIRGLTGLIFCLPAPVCLDPAASAT